MRPVYDALNDAEFKSKIQFHMPGHLRGRGFENFELSAEMDVTELPETDDLHSPEGVIKASQQNAARVFGSEKAYYMVNGSTGGVLAMVLGFLSDGDKVIADRFSHKSFVSALALSGAVPVWVTPETMRNKTMWSGASAKDIKKAIEENPDAKAVFITAPNYFGLMEDVGEIAKCAKKHGMKLLVDGAHGAHYGFYEKLPPSLISLGANAVCLSLHKTLPALTQTAMLLTDERYERVEAALKTVQSSSPSYLLTSSAEYAVSFCENTKKEAWERLYENVSRLFPEEIKYNEKCVKYKDFTRINARVKGNPFEAAEKLGKEFGISVECAYGEGIIAILNVFHRQDEIEKLRTALDKVCCTPCEPLGFVATNTKTIFTPREAFFAKKRRIKLSEAEGKISAEGLMVYPPGVYQVLPGEVIDKESILLIENLSKRGAEIPQLKESYCLIFDE
jgi:arginine decarboxylase